MQELNPNIEEITLEARKAYRFLFQYQQCILNLMGFSCGSLGLKYAGGYSKFSNTTPRSGRGNLDNWAWDWLNMYFYEFHFEKEDGVKFSVFIINDTGYYDSACAPFPEKRVNIEEFEIVEKSDTKLIFVAAKNLWDSTQWGEWQSHDFLTKDLKIEQEDKIMISKVYSLNEFATEDNAIKSLKEFEKYCHQYHIPIQYQKKL